MVVDVTSSASAHRNVQRLDTCPPQSVHRGISSTPHSNSEYQNFAENHRPASSSLQARELSNSPDLLHSSPGRRVVSVATSMAGSNHTAQLYSCPVVSQLSFNSTLLMQGSATNPVQHSHDPLTLPSSIGKPPAMHASSSSPSSQATSKPKHMCKVCGKVFKRAHNLKIHGRLHNGDRPYSCPFPNCNKEFRWKSSIVSHVNWHRTKRGDTLPPDAIVVQKTTSRRQLAPFLKPSTTINDSKSLANGDNKKHLTKDCVGFIPRCLNTATVSTSSSDGTEHESLKLPSNMAHGTSQGNIVLRDAATTFPFSAISSKLEMQFAREQALPSKKVSTPQAQNFPVFEGGTTSQEVPEQAHNKAFPTEDGNSDDFVDQLVERNLTLSSQEELFIDEYVNGDVHGRLDMGFHSSINPVAITGEMKDNSSGGDIIDDEQRIKAEQSTIVTPSTDSFEIFPSTKSSDLEEGALSFFENEEWGERNDTASTEGLMAGLLLHPGCRVDRGAELLTGSLEEEI